MKIRMIAILSLLAALWCAGCDDVFNNAMDEMAFRQTSWYTFLGGMGAEEARSIQQTADGGYIVAGNTNSDMSSQLGSTPVNGYAGNGDMLVVKLDASGSVAWHTFLGSDQPDTAYSVQQTSDGGYIVAGITYEDIPSLQMKNPIIDYSHSSTQYNNLVVKLDASGNVAWYTFLGETRFSAYNSVQQTTDGGYIVAGAAATDISSQLGNTPINPYSSNYNNLVVKLDASGNVAWYTFLGETPDNTEISVQQTTDGGCIVAGIAATDISPQLGNTPQNAYSGSQDILVVKLNASGSVAWYTFLGGTSTEIASSIQQTSDGGYIVAGHADVIPTLQGKTPINDFAGGLDMLVVKLNSSGNVAWYTFLGGTGFELAGSIQQTADDGYIVSGGTFADIPTLQGKTPINDFAGGVDILLVKLNSSGSVTWFTFLGGTSSDSANSIQQTADGGYIVAGYAYDIPSLQGKTPLIPHKDSNDILVVKLKNDGTL